MIGGHTLAMVEALSADISTLSEKRYPARPSNWVTCKADTMADFNAGRSSDTQLSARLAHQMMPLCAVS